MVKNNVSESVVWFMEKARSAAGYRTNLMANTKRSKGITQIGRMYFFWYDPKHKATLPIYDKFPMVFPIEGYSDGFLGINLHYLGVGMREALLNKLSSFQNNNRLDATTKLRLSYDVLRSAALLDVVKPCLKRYLYGHVRSRFVEITADEWPKAIGLPVDLFVHQNPSFDKVKRQVKGKQQ
jgi:hypothetical protein